MRRHAAKPHHGKLEVTNSTKSGQPIIATVLMAEFNPDFQFDFGADIAPRQTPWDFTGKSNF